MRGSDLRSGELFSYIDLEERVPAKHPLRKIRQIVNDVLQGLDNEFARLYAVDGRPSIPPERLLRASLLQAFYTIRVMPEACFQHDAPADGAARRQSALSLVCGSRHRRPSLGAGGVYLSRLLAHQEVSPLLSDEHPRLRGDKLLRRRHTAPGVGVDIAECSARSFTNEKLCAKRDVRDLG